MKIAILALLLVWAAAAQPADPLRGYLERLALEQLARRDAHAAELRTRAAWDNRRAEVRRAFLAMLGGLPKDRTPLNLRRTGTLDRGDYRVEKIIFESLPGLYVTANLYVPQTGRPPYPAVLHPTGHSTAAKNRAFYQMLSIGLAKQGFVTLTYDPIGQGERRVWYDPDLQDSKVGSSTLEHTMLGIRSLLAGESMARYMVWDAMRALDVLESLPAVDRNRLGVTGCSGGGTLTAYLAALDPRVKAAAPSCYVTSWEQQVRSLGPQDAEQQFPDQFKAGIDHADLVALAAPMPYLICSSTEDFFPLEGARKTFEASRRVWELYGAADRIDWFHEPGTHGVYKAGRERIYAWMRRWLRGGSSATPAEEPPIRTEYEEDLNCTPTGQLATSLGGETASSVSTRRYAALEPSRPIGSDLRDRLLRLTRYDRGEAPLNLQTLERREAAGYTVERLSFDSDRGLTVPALLLVPPAATRTVLYVNQGGKGSYEKPHSDALELVRFGYAVLAVDAAGTGELASHWQGYADQWFGQEKVAWLALMTGRPLVALQMRDILRGVEVLSARGLPAAGVTGVGRGTVAVALLHAAILEPRFGRLVLEDMPASYSAIARAPIHRRIFEAVIPGVLGQYDLPDLVTALAPRAVNLLNVRSPTGALLLRRDAEGIYGKPDCLTIGLRREAESLGDAAPAIR